jgi:3-hydroxyisobutyrate dehydrogenase-like beta-hydroxyacid dehydrogenase
MNVGFIGLGSMGREIAARLVEAGHAVCVWNRSPEPAEKLRGLGAVVAATPKEAFRGDAVITMLADDNALRSVFLDQGLLDGAPAGLIHVVMSTISVEFAGEFARAHARRGLRYVAAPVFGRPEAAAAGRLNIVAAGDEEAIARVQPLLDVAGERTWPMGPNPIHANVVKLCGNFLLVSAVEALSESIALARGYEVEPARFLDIMTNTSFASPIYKAYGSSIANERYYPGGFKLRLAFKDVKLALAAAEASHAPMPFGGVLRDACVEAIAHGDADADLAVLAKVAAMRAGLPS